MEVIQMKDVSFHYTGDVPILENVNICLNSGDYAILTGENGSGKSTFLKLWRFLEKKLGKRILKNLRLVMCHRTVSVETKTSRQP